MNQNFFKHTTKLMVAASAVAIFTSCAKDEFTEKQALDLEMQRLRANRQIDSLSRVQARVEAVNLLRYRRSLDSLDAINAGGRVMYTVNVVSGNSAIFAGGRSEDSEGVNGAIVTTSMYGTVVSATTVNGIATFGDLRSGEATVTISAPGHTTANYVTNLTPENSGSASGPSAGNNTNGGTGQSGTGAAKNGTIVQVGNVIPLFALGGAGDASIMATIRGRGFMETNVTNDVEELVPAGTAVTAAIDVTRGATGEGDAGSSITGSWFWKRYIHQNNADADRQGSSSVATSTIPQIQRVGAIQKISYGTGNSFNNVNAGGTHAGAVTRAVTDAQGNYSLIVPATAVGLPMIMNFDELAANRTFFRIGEDGTTRLVTNERFLYGPSVAADVIPVGVVAPRLTFSAFTTQATATATYFRTVTSTAYTVGDVYLATGGWYMSLPTASGISVGTGGTVSVNAMTGTLNKDNTGFQGEPLVAAATRLKQVPGVTITAGGSGYTANGTVTFTRTDLSDIGTATQASALASGVANYAHIRDGGKDFDDFNVALMSRNVANQFTGYIPGLTDVAANGAYTDGGSPTASDDGSAALYVAGSVTRGITLPLSNFANALRILNHAVGAPGSPEAFEVLNPATNSAFVPTPNPKAAGFWVLDSTIGSVREVRITANGLGYTSTANMPLQFNYGSGFSVPSNDLDKDPLFVSNGAAGIQFNIVGWAGSSYPAPIDVDGLTAGTQFAAGTFSAYNGTNPNDGGIHTADVFDESIVGATLPIRYGRYDAWPSPPTSVTSQTVRFDQAQNLTAGATSGSTTGQYTPPTGLGSNRYVFVPSVTVTPSVGITITVSFTATVGTALHPVAALRGKLLALSINPSSTVNAATGSRHNNFLNSMTGVGINAYKGGAAVTRVTNLAQSSDGQAPGVAIGGTLIGTIDLVINRPTNSLEAFAFPVGTGLTTYDLKLKTDFVKAFFAPFATATLEKRDDLTSDAGLQVLGFAPTFTANALERMIEDNEWLVVADVPQSGGRRAWGVPLFNNSNTEVTGVAFLDPGVGYTPGIANRVTMLPNLFRNNALRGSVTAPGTNWPAANDLVGNANGAGNHAPMTLARPSVAAHTRFTMTNKGAGYSSTPSVEVFGFGEKFNLFQDLGGYGTAANQVANGVRYQNGQIVAIGTSLIDDAAGTGRVVGVLNRTDQVGTSATLSPTELADQTVLEVAIIDRLSSDLTDGFLLATTKTYGAAGTTPTDFGVKVDVGATGSIRSIWLHRSFVASDDWAQVEQNFRPTITISAPPTAGATTATAIIPNTISNFISDSQTAIGLVTGGFSATGAGGSNPFGVIGSVPVRSKIRNIQVTNGGTGYAKGNFYQREFTAVAAAAVQGRAMLNGQDFRVVGGFENGGAAGTTQIGTVLGTTTGVGVTNPSNQTNRRFDTFTGISYVRDIHYGTGRMLD